MTVAHKSPWELEWAHSQIIPCYMNYKGAYWHSEDPTWICKMSTKCSDWFRQPIKNNSIKRHVTNKLLDCKRAQSTVYSCKNLSWLMIIKFICYWPLNRNCAIGTREITGRWVLSQLAKPTHISNKYFLEEIALNLEAFYWYYTCNWSLNVKSCVWSTRL